MATDLKIGRVERQEYNVTEMMKQWRLGLLSDAEMLGYILCLQDEVVANMLSDASGAAFIRDFKG